MSIDDLFFNVQNEWYAHTPEHKVHTHARARTHIRTCYSPLAYLPYYRCIVSIYNM